MTWVPQECTLPTVERPLRVAEFDALFAGATAGVERAGPGLVRLLLDRAVEPRARELAAREQACCSFFSFRFETDARGRLVMEIGVPPDRQAVLDALAERARAASGED
ncbi:hypothetical protein BX265_0933 [Streptomyces sp. TLI_235]|nr:hypothetical protein [Streptomyces sp. TLI_235]PBC76227.1 hypothetical protein BX265_0933 [Streptomyces sp. TLI_235]